MAYTHARGGGGSLAATYEEEVVVARGWHLLGVLSNADACRISRGMVVKAKGDDVQRSVQRLGLPMNLI
jgi:hypothetical protein